MVMTAENSRPQGAAGASKPLRKDAERNRQLILSAAARLFAERGTGVGFEEIAQAAEVGVGTVYRRFPDRHALIAALVEHRYDPILTKWEKSLEQSWEPQELLEEFCLQLVHEAAADTGLRQTLFELADDESAVQLRGRIASLFATVVSRAKDAGLLRAGITPEDIALVTIALSHLQGTSDLAPRYVRLFLEGAYEVDVPRGHIPGMSPSPEEAQAILNGA